MIYSVFDIFNPKCRSYHPGERVDTGEEKGADRVTEFPSGDGGENIASQS